MSRLSRNIVYNLSGKILLLFLSFVAVKYIFSRLGADALGIIYFTATLNLVLGTVLRKGVVATTVREVSVHFQEQPEYIYHLVRTGSLVCYSVLLLVGIVVYLCAPILVRRWINLNTMDPATAIYLLRVLGFASFTVFIDSFYASLLDGLQRMEFNNFIEVVTSALRQFGTIIILMLGGTLYQIVYWWVANYFLKVLGYAIVVAYFFSAKALIPGYWPYVFKRNLDFGANMTVISILAFVHRQMDKIIISRLLPIGVLGYYGYADNSISKAGFISSTIARAAFPSLSALSQHGSRKSLLAQYRKLQDLICFITVPIFAVIPFAALPLYTYLFNEQIAKALFLPVTFLSLGFYMNGTSTLSYQLSLAVGRPKIIVHFVLLACFVVLPATVLLIYFWGIAGAGFSWVLYNIFVYVYAVPRVSMECLKVPVWKWYAHVLKFYVLAGLTYGLTWIAIEVLDHRSVSSLFLAYVIASTAFLTAGFLTIGDELRKTALQYVAVSARKLRLKWKIICAD